MAKNFIINLLGEDSILFDAGLENNFIYSIKTDQDFSIDDFNKTTFGPKGKISKITFRLQQLIDQYSSIIKFRKIQSSQLWRNLKMVDGDLPEIIAYCLLYRWMDRTPFLSELVTLIERRDPLNFYNGKPSEQNLYDCKLKKFLAECAMGMTSEIPWQGIHAATGGVNISKQGGDIVPFDIYNFNLFREYLIKNVKFELFSTGVDEGNHSNLITKAREGIKKTKNYYYGWLCKENNELLFKINLQVKFI